MEGTRALLNYSCRKGSYYSGVGTNRGWRSNRGSMVSLHKLALILMPLHLQGIKKVEEAEMMQDVTYRNAPGKAEKLR